jgi:hypothetical protein
MILKCRLRPIDTAQYPPLSPAQSARLASIFPNGVCDYSQPGVEQQPLAGTDQEFGPARVMHQRKRALGLSVRVKRGRSGSVASLVATLKPCPATIWQRIIFQRRKGAHWRSVGSRIANGSKCRASVSVGIGKKTRVRAISKFSPGYAGTHSKVRQVKPLPRRR